MAKATIKMIAEIAGVSRGTVDRVLNDRPYVKKDIADRVRQVAEELNYTPNAVAKALKTQKKAVIAVIVPPRDNELFREVRRGVRRAQKEYEEYGISLELLTMKKYTIEEQERLLHEVEKKEYHGVAIAPFDALAVKRAIKRILAAGTPVVIFNTKVSGLDTMSFVGQDTDACGRVAAQLMGMMLGGKGAVAISIGKRNISAHISRAAGLEEYIEQNFPRMAVVDDFENFENDDVAYRLCWGTFRKNENIDGMFVTGAGLEGIGRFLKETGRAGKVKVVCTDFGRDAVGLLKEGVVDFAIGQQPFQQGYYPVKILAENILRGLEPAKKNIFTMVDIRTKENIDFSFVGEDDVAYPTRKPARKAAQTAEEA